MIRSKPVSNVSNDASELSPRNLMESFDDKKSGEINGLPIRPDKVAHAMKAYLESAKNNLPQNVVRALEAKMERIQTDVELPISKQQ